MEMRLVQTFIPVVLSATEDSDIFTTLTRWIEKYWWLPTVLMVLGMFFFFLLTKDKSPSNFTNAPSKEKQATINKGAV